MAAPASEIHCDIAIIGGGMMGLSLVHLLQRYLPGLRLCLLERFPLDTEKLYQPSFDQRSTAISRDSADIFAGLGLWPAMAEHSTAIRRVHVSDRGHVGTTAYSEADNDDRALGYVVDNAWLGQCLAKGLGQQQQLNVLAPAQVNALRPTTEGARIEALIDGQTQHLHCTLAVIADGAQSPLRSALGIATEVYDYQQSAVIANVAFEKPHGGDAFERFTAQGPVALLPLGESDAASTAALVWTTPCVQVDTVMDWSEEVFTAELQQAFGYRLGAFTRVGTRHHYPLKSVLAKEQVRSSMVLMGNAAHALHPVAGQGFNLALRDAEQLVKVLVGAQTQGKALGALSVLQTYVERQYSDQWLTSMISHGFNRVFADSRTAVQAARNLGLISLNMCPPIKKSFFNQMMGKGTLVV